MLWMIFLNRILAPGIFYLQDDVIKSLIKDFIYKQLNVRAVEYTSEVMHVTELIFSLFNSIICCLSTLLCVSPANSRFRCGHL